jgi:WD40 repeat protein
MCEQISLIAVCCVVSSTGKYIVCGSEDHFIFLWKTNHEFLKFTSARRDRNSYWEAIKGTSFIIVWAWLFINYFFLVALLVSSPSYL